MSRNARSVASSDDDDREWDSDANEEDAQDREEKIRIALASRSDKERERFALFRSANCKIPKAQVLDIVQRAVPGVTVQKLVGNVAADAARLFVADLIETAKRMSSNKEEPLTPDMIMIAYSELEGRGKIPGKGPGIRRSEML